MAHGYVFKVLLYIDMFVAALIWRDSGVTISSYAGLALRQPTPPIWALILGRGILNKIQANHCELAIEHDIERAKEALVILGVPLP
jgi:hypothetical protein